MGGVSVAKGYIALPECWSLVLGTHIQQLPVTLNYRGPSALLQSTHTALNMHKPTAHRHNSK